MHRAKSQSNCGIVIGTGPSLTESAPTVRKLQEQGVKLFGCNNTFNDFDLDVWIACDPAWHEHYGQVEGDFDKRHWDRDICQRFGYHYIEGVWMVDGKAYPRDQYERCPGLSGGLWIEDKSRISLNHGSGPQILNLAVLYGCDPILLVGHDFSDSGKRHYFTDLSDQDGEYPEPLRKWSKFDKQGKGDDMLAVYRRISEQPGLPTIYNCTPNSKLPWFPRQSLESFLV